MTTVCILEEDSDYRRISVEGKLLMAVLVCLVSCTSVLAQGPPVHWRYTGAMPPGAIGRLRLFSGKPLSGFYQPVKIRVPQGARIGPAVGSSFELGQADQLLVGLQVGPVYRFRVTEIPHHPGLEVYPTVELIDRLHPPPGEQLRYPIPIELTHEELMTAAEGRFVTRVIYLEDPALAPAIARDAEEQPWIEALAGEDPLVTADELGRPMAIVRLGGRVPVENQRDEAFLYGAPPAVTYEQPQQSVAAQ